jgi:hypothetical protein
MCHLQELYAKFGDKGLVVLGCDFCDDKKIALEMLADNRVTFPNIIDSSDAATKVCFRDYQRFGRSAVPLSYIIGPDGKIVVGWYGYEEGEQKAIAAMQKVGGELAEAVRKELRKKAAKSTDEINGDALKALKAGGDAMKKAVGDLQNVAKVADAVSADAHRLFEAIRTADYDRDWTRDNQWKQFPAKDVVYSVDRTRHDWVAWVCKKFKANPIADVQLGEVFAGLDGQPTIHFELRLKDGEKLKGDLPFHWDAKKKQWIGSQGLDWHL